MHKSDFFKDQGPKRSLFNMDQQDNLESTFAALLSRRAARSQLRRLTTVAPGMIDFSSNSYLSLSSQPAVQRSFMSLLQSHFSETSAATAESLGSGGSRLLDGNSSFAEALETKIAAFHGAPAGLLFNSGFDANVGLLSCVPQPGDIIVYDELVHASMHDGMKLSRAAYKLPFLHNSVDSNFNECSDGMRGLTDILGGITTGALGKDAADGKTNVFIAVEGVYSMDGDVAPLAKIVECVEKCLPNGNGYIIVDEAHSTGIFGERGQGLVSQLGLESKVFARVHTFGKAMGCSGAIVLSSPITRTYLINYARALIYTTAMSLPSLASIKVAYDFLMDGHGKPLISNLQSLMRHAHGVFWELCARYRPAAEILHLSSDLPKSPIIPLFTSQPRSLAQHCQERGFMIRPIVAPTVPRGKERVRICLHARNTFEEVVSLLRAVEDWLRLQLRQSANVGTSSDVTSMLAGDEQQGQGKLEKARI